VHKIKESYKRIRQLEPIQAIEQRGHFTTLGTYNSGHFHAGFTLIEILIAISIFAVVLTTIYTSYTGTFRVVNETESQAEIYQMARIALERMLEDLESAYIPKNPETENPEENHRRRPSQFVGEDGEIKGRCADTLRFTSRAHINLSGQEQDPGTVEIGYYVMENEEGDDFVLYRSDRPMFEEAFPLEEAGGLVLCERLMSVDFTYHEEGGEVCDSWDSASDAFKDRLPEMVSISLEFVNSSNPEVSFRFTTSVALPMSGDINDEAS